MDRLVRFANKDLIMRLDDAEQEADFFSDPRRSLAKAIVKQSSQDIWTTLRIDDGAHILIAPMTDFDYSTMTRRSIEMLNIGLEYFENGRGRLVRLR